MFRRYSKVEHMMITIAQNLH